MCHSALDWQVLIEDVIPENIIKLNNKISFILNIVIPVFTLWIFDLKFLHFLILFLICDILQAVFEFALYIIIKYFKNTLNSISWQLQQKEYVNKFSNLSPLELENLKESLNKEDAFYNEKLKLLNDRIDEFKSMNSIVITNSRKTEIAYIEEVILKFSSYEGIDWIEIKLNDLVEISQRLLALVKEDIDSLTLVINTFNIYAEELMKIIVQYESLDDEQQEKYISKIEDLFNVFYNHLENLENKIVSSRERSIDFDIDYLTKKIKNEMENGNHKEENDV